LLDSWQWITIADFKIAELEEVLAALPLLKILLFEMGI
jgi:hypothetical protein